MTNILSDSSNLRDLHESFISQYGNIRIRNFWEAKPIWLRLGVVPLYSTYVVPENSATFHHKGTLNTMLHVDHMNLNKFERKDANYQKVLNCLLEFLETGPSPDVAFRSIESHSSLPPLLQIPNVQTFTVNLSDSREVWDLFTSPPSATKRTKTTFQASVKARHPETCHWIKDDPDFQWWSAEKASALLWITGNLGSGKTVLCAYLMQLLSQSSGRHQVPLLAAFCSADVMDDDLLILRCLIRQLLDNLPYLQEQALPSLQEAMEEYISSGYWSTDSFVEKRAGSRATPLSTTDRNRKKQELSEDITFLWTVLRILLRSVPSLYIVVDGLDTLAVSAMENIVEGFERYLFPLDESCVKIILTSRPNEHVRSSVSRYEENTCHRLQTETTTYIKDDIRKFLSTELHRIYQFRGWPNSKENRFLEMVIRASSDMFLYASFMVEKLRYSSSLYTEEILNEVPDTLDQLYGQALKAIAPSIRGRQSNILLFMLYSYRTLTRLDLQGALVSAKVSGNPADARMAITSDLLLYGPLIRFDQSNDSVDFIHPTAKAYLLKQANSTSLEHSPFLANFRKGHATLSEGCLRYIISRANLSFPMYYADNFNRELRRIYQENPGLDYALSHWHLHCAETSICDPHYADGQTLLMLLRRLDTLRKAGGGSLSFWFHLLWSIKTAKFSMDVSTFEQDLRKFTSLEFFTLCGQAAAVDMEIRKDSTGDSKALVPRIRDKSIEFAFKGGQSGTIRILLDHFQISSLDEDKYRDAIPDVVDTGDAGLLLEVLKLRPKPSLRELAMALYSAVSTRNVAAGQVILDQVDVINDKDDNGMTILHWVFWAMITSNDDTIGALSLLNTALLIVKQGALINAQDNLGNTILHYLCYSYMGHEWLIKKLTDEGANPLLPNKFGWLPVHLLVRKCGNVSSVKFLAQRYPGCLIHRTRGDATVLHWAVQRHAYQRSNGPVLKYLLCSGLRLDMEDRRGIRPLEILQRKLFLAHSLYLECTPMDMSSREIVPPRLLLQYDYSYESGAPLEDTVLLEELNDQSNELDEREKDALWSQIQLVGPLVSTRHEYVNLRIHETFGFRNSPASFPEGCGRVTELPDEPELSLSG
ncbi:hypothetical protein, variant [Phialophora macrospora]|uniref:Nephrocystin 3-like N-terminal domain-containing protein n=1 Tax=Phialophora macrospora TaxID=1851006 RepID=A0A0D2FYP7_9EURO|nr:hypothetical protein PV04_03743 [Phialophora macrospora]KIW71600.1 hypothetical protein, variant [Phialophora macrospora]